MRFKNELVNLNILKLPQSNTIKIKEDKKGTEIFTKFRFIDHVPMYMLIHIIRNMIIVGPNVKYRIKPEM